MIELITVRAGLLVIARHVGNIFADQLWDCREHKAEGSGAGGAKGKGVLYWLRQDFRLHDNPALSAAAQAAKKQACSFHSLSSGRAGMAV